MMPALVPAAPPAAAAGLPESMLCCAGQGMTAVLHVRQLLTFSLKHVYPCSCVMTRCQVCCRN